MMDSQKEIKKIAEQNFLNYLLNENVKDAALLIKF